VGQSLSLVVFCLAFPQKNEKRNWRKPLLFPSVAGVAFTVREAVSVTEGVDVGSELLVLSSSVICGAVVAGVVVVVVVVAATVGI